MKLVVGLGNPGRKYEKTRHNVGWEVIAELGRRYGDGKVKQKFYGEAMDAAIGGERAVLLAPHTFMNRSGKSVIAARDFYKIDDSDILVISDDLNLPLAKLRLRPSGSAGGQKGLADIMRALGTQDISRLRIGIEQPPPSWDAADYVLSKFKKDERADIDEAIRRAADAVAVWAHEGVEIAMNQFN